MTTRLLSLLFIFFLVAALGIMQQLAFEYYLYWRIFWYDIVMHFLGGAIIGALFLWFMRFKFPEASIKKYFRFSMVFLFVFAVGVLWEVYEYIIGIDSAYSTASRAWDTLKDLAMDILGATLAYMLFRKFIKNV